MSFAIFLSSFEDGRTIPLPNILLDTVFGEFRTGGDADCWKLRFPNGGECEMTLDYASPAAGITVSRPPASLEFWDGILAILKQTPSCLYWPGGGPVVADIFVRNHLPADMLEGLGEPVAVHSAMQIIDAIKNS